MISVQAHPELHPAHPDCQRWLGEVVPGLVVLRMCPAGGERYGHLTVAAVPCDHVHGLAHAVVALWKGAACMDEEWTYDLWRPDRDTWAFASYRERYAAWSASTSRSEADFLGWLLPRCVETIRAQHTLEPPLCAPDHHPDPAAVRSAGIEELDYLREPALRAVLLDRWNDCEGLFQHRGWWFLASWGTSA